MSVTRGTHSSETRRMSGAPGGSRSEQISDKAKGTSQHIGVIRSEPFRHIPGDACDDTRRLCNAVLHARAGEILVGSVVGILPLDLEALAIIAYSPAIPIGGPGVYIPNLLMPISV